MDLDYHRNIIFTTSRDFYEDKKDQDFNNPIHYERKDKSF